MLRPTLFLAIAVALAPWLRPAAPGAIRFEEVAAKSGLRFVTENSPTAEKTQIEPMIAGVALFHNNGDGTFTDVTVKAGLAGAGYGMGVAVGDYDNDGRPDLFVANVTGNQLFHNNGDGTFTDVTAKAGLAGAQMNGKKMWSVGAGWFDYNNDGLLDLFVVNYCKWDVNKDPNCTIGGGTRSYCDPRYYAPTHNTLYRNNGDGTFTDVSA